MNIIKISFFLFITLMSGSVLNCGKTKKKRDRRKLAQKEIFEEYNLVERLNEHLKIIDDCFVRPVEIKPDETELQRQFRLDIDTMRTIVVAQQQTINNLENTFYEKNNRLPDYGILRAGIQSLKQKHINTILKSEKFLLLAQKLSSMNSDSDFSDIGIQITQHITLLMTYENGFTAYEKTPLQMLQFSNLLHTFVLRLIQLEVHKENINLLKQAFFCASAPEYYKYLKKIKNAFHSKNIIKIIALLQEGALPSWHVTQHANTALTIAVTEEAVDLVKILLYCPSIDINAQTKYGDSALIIAAKKRNVAITQLLLEEVDYRYDEQMQDLVEFQVVNLNAQNKQRETALIAAIQLSANKVAQIILSYKPNTALCDHNGYNAYDWACYKNNKKIIGLLTS